MELYLTDRDGGGLSRAAIREALEASLEGRRVARALLLPPDHTRIRSGAGEIANFYYHLLTERGAEVDVMPTLGTHAPMTEAELSEMFGDVPHERFFVHDWRHGVKKLGEVPAEFVSRVTDGLWREAVPVTVSRRVTDGDYDLIISPGQVVPHEVVGMSNHSKNIFVGAGGSEMINASHMIGAVYGMERMMGRADTPVRRIFDYAAERFLSSLPILWVLTVAGAPRGETVTHGLFIGEGRECFTEAARLARERNVVTLPRAAKKCVVYLDPGRYRSTWLGNKAIYRTRMLLADGGELVILAPGVERFGEDAECDRLIRKYGYRGRDAVLAAFARPEGADLRANMSAAAHLIHGSPDGRFTVTYAVKNIGRDEIASVGYEAADYTEALRRFDPARLRPGFSDTGEGELFFVPDPAAGLWAERGRFNT